MKVIIITGASSGIGKHTADLLAKQGHKVYGAARRVEQMESLKVHGVIPVQLDVTDTGTIDQAIAKIIQREGRIDVLISNAGYGSYGAVEDVPMEEARRQFDVNLFGVASLTKAVLPYMRKQGSGRIINTSSMGGRMVTFLGAWYHATKYALEAFSDALRMEVKDFGIDVVLIEPGAIKTEFGEVVGKQIAAVAKGGAYEEVSLKLAKSIPERYQSGLMSNPSVVANAISKAVNSRRPKASYLIGFMAKPFVFLHTILPTSAFDWMMKKL